MARTLHPFRMAVLVAALSLIAPTAHAQQFRLTRPTGWTPDSLVRSVLESGSASLTPETPVDETVPRLWLTRAERTRWKQTSDYDEVVRYLRQLEGGSRWVKVESFGRSGQGRDLPLVILSKDRAFTPEAARATGKPIVLIQNGIHAGEIEGKDASLMLLRDIGVLQRRTELLDSVIVLVVPILSADAHERRSRYHRMNQNGPDEMGWRHTPIGLNLNRDHTKLDSPEMRGLIGNVYARWWPELLVDNHTTDGADYRYSVTWSVNHGAGVPAALDRWMGTVIEKGVMGRLATRGHLTAPYVDFHKGRDPLQGLDYGNSMGRFSTGYAPLQSRAALLVETHMLKPYGARVRATYDLLIALLEEIHANPSALVNAVRGAEDEAVARATGRAGVRRTQVLSTTLSERSEPFVWRGVETRWETSPITGAPVARYLAAPADSTVPLYRETVPALSVRVPSGGYLVPQEWAEVTDRLALHGIRTRRLAQAWTDSVEMTRITEYRFEPRPYEGRQMVTVLATESERQSRRFRAGDVWVPLDQPGGPLAVQLLEAQGPDGFLAWGFLSTIFQRKEYGEDYVLDPLGRAMMERDPKLASEFLGKVASDTTFARDPRARADWFYRRSPWNDADQDLHPFARLSRRVPEGSLVPLPGTAPVAPPAPTVAPTPRKR